MLKKEVLEKLTAIGTCEDDAERRDLLTTLSDEIEKDYDERDTLKTTNDDLLAKNKKLRSTNMELFVQVGASRLEDIDEPEKKEEKQGEKLSFESLFNEKGELK